MMFCFFSCQKEVVYYDDGYYNNPHRSYYNRQVPRKYDSFKAPGSRNYQNPYSTPPNKYYPYYDSDYYYVPPTDYDPYSQDDDFFKGGRFDINTNIM